MKALEIVHVILNSCTFGRNFYRPELAKQASLYKKNLETKGIAVMNGTPAHTTSHTRTWATVDQIDDRCLYAVEICYNTLIITEFD